MENSFNPYRPPSAKLEAKGNFKRSIWWKIYFFFITIQLVLGIRSMFLAQGSGIVEYVSIAIILVGIIGFFGFVFVKPIYNPRFWLVILFISIVYGMAQYFITNIDLKNGLSDTEFYIAHIIAWLLFFPQYFGL